MTELLIPGLLLFVSLWALSKKQDVYSQLLLGAQDGLRLLVSIAPALIVLLSAVAMLRASGFLDALSSFLAPVCRAVGIPPEVVPLMLVRPLSGSAALAVGLELMQAHGVDSRVGLTAAVMLGSTETTFYTIAVYFGAAGIKQTRYAVPAALCADLAGFLAAALTTRLLLAPA